MENSTPLHAQKVTILSRLVKESSLTLEEALVLLKEEENEEVIQPLNQGPYVPGTGTPWIQPYGSGIPYNGIGSISSSGFVLTASNNPDTTAFTTNSTLTADLNS